MGKRRSLFADVKAMARASRISAGSLSLRGVPAILAGVSFVIFAAGIAKMLDRSVALLPETLREIRELWNCVSVERRALRAQAAPAESLANPFGQRPAGAEVTEAKRAGR
ncbi:MAG: hypothetical protein ACLPSH_03920 [Vulcanimicrobiaceae bacterium]